MTCLILQDMPGQLQAKLFLFWEIGLDEFDSCSWLSQKNRLLILPQVARYLVAEIFRSKDVQGAALPGLLGNQMQGKK